MIATFTENYSFIKPDPEDYYDIQDFNENMDAVDGHMGEMDRAVTEVGDKIDGVSTAVTGVGNKVTEVKNLIGKPTDTGESTLFGKLSGSGTQVYVSSNTARRSWGSTIITASGNSFTFSKLFHFRAKHNGTIRLTIQMEVNSGSSGNKISVFKNPAPAMLTMPAFTHITTQTEHYFAADIFLGVARLAPVTVDTVFTVEQGSIYCFFLNTSSCDKVTISSAKICYDLADPDNIVEF